MTHMLVKGLLGSNQERVELYIKKKCINVKCNVYRCNVKLANFDCLCVMTVVINAVLCGLSVTANLLIIYCFHICMICQVL